MIDPFDALRAPSMPADPDPVFATRLRARLERALALPRGVLVSETRPDPRPMSDAVPAAAQEPVFRHGDVGYAWLSVPDVDRAVAFYSALLGWTVAPGSDGQGRQVVGRSPHLGLHGGEPRGTLNCCYAVDDVTAAVGRVRAAGGRASKPSEAPYGLVANCTDDQGTVFALYQPPGGVGTGPPAMGSHGDLAYVSFEVVDSARYRAFYAAVLGWNFTSGSIEDGWQIQGVMAGMHGGHAQVTTLPMWRVDDLVLSIDRVRATGGTATEPQTRPYGQEAECADDQGTRFYLGQL